VIRPCRRGWARCRWSGWKLRSARWPGTWPRRRAIHHVQHWLDGGPTNYANLCLLCWRHHTSHHHGNYHITHDHTAPGHFPFHRPDTAPIPHAPPPPPLTGDITGCHTASITPDTIQPDRHDPLNLHYAASVMPT
jgi:HNH endonuclease